MKNETWTGLTEYSLAHGLSVSTLRRRIKSGLMRYKLIDGKYYILENPELEAIEANSDVKASSDLLEEVKRAYMNVLQEKEDQILHLREEISDLKTLVRALETENERLKNISTRQRR